MPLWRMPFWRIKPLMLTKHKLQILYVAVGACFPCGRALLSLPAWRNPEQADVIISTIPQGVLLRNPLKTSAVFFILNVACWCHWISRQAAFIPRGRGGLRSCPSLLQKKSESILSLSSALVSYLYTQFSLPRGSQIPRTKTLQCPDLDGPG